MAAFHGAPGTWKRLALIFAFAMLARGERARAFAWPYPDHGSQDHQIRYVKMPIPLILDLAS